MAPGTGEDEPNAGATSQIRFLSWGQVLIFRVLMMYQTCLCSLVGFKRNLSLLDICLLLIGFPPKKEEEEEDKTKHGKMKKRQNGFRGENSCWFPKIPSQTKHHPAIADRRSPGDSMDGSPGSAREEEMRENAVAPNVKTYGKLLEASAKARLHRLHYSWHVFSCVFWFCVLFIVSRGLQKTTCFCCHTKGCFKHHLFGP